MRVKLGWVAVAAMLAAGSPAAAQFSDGFKFLKAVRDGDGAAVMEELSKPGSSAINTRSDTGETALHLVVRRRDTTWLGFLLSKGAKPELRDKEGMTPLALAAQLGYAEGIDILGRRGNVNTANSRGETPLILAVHNRDIASVRELIALGANPDQKDNFAGKSARDYAREDTRAVPIAKLFDGIKAAAPKQVAGPGL